MAMSPKMREVHMAISDKLRSQLAALTALIPILENEAQKKTSQTV